MPTDMPTSTELKREAVRVVESEITVITTPPMQAKIKNFR